MSRRRNALDVPFKQPNWLGSILFLIIHVTSKSSKTLDRQGVRDIGLNSPSVVGNWVFGIVVMFVSFQIAGTIPVATGASKIVVTGSTYL